MIFLSVGYLIIELAFSARLLDAVWGAENVADIEDIEKVGRILSGIALWLALLGTWGARKYGHSSFQFFLFFFISGFISIYSMYTLQEHIVKSLVNDSSAKERLDSVYINLLANGLKNETIKLEGISLKDAEEGSAKAFIGIFPFLGRNINNIDAKVSDRILEIVKQNVEIRIGQPQVFYNQQYVPTLKAFKSLYNNYADLTNDHYKELEEFNLSKYKKEKWNEYVREVKQKTKKYPWQIRFYWQKKRIQKDMIAKFPDLPKNWKIDNSKAFYKAIDKQFKKNAQKNAQKKVRVLFDKFYDKMLRQGTSVSSNRVDSKPGIGLTWKAFQNTPYIKKLFQSVFRQYQMERYLSLNMSYQTFFKKFYSQEVNFQAKKIMNRIKSSEVEYEKDGKHYAIGIDSYKLTIIPIIALFFSLIGAIFHILKLQLMISMIFISSSSIKTIMTACIACGLFLYPYMKPNKIVNSNLYYFMDNRMHENDSFYTPIATEFIIRLEGAYYPFNTMIRNEYLDGSSFGYNTPQKLVMVK